MKQHRQYLWAVLVLLVSTHILNAQPLTQSGREFYIAFPPNMGSDETMNRYELAITSEENTTGYVKVPNLGFFQQFEIAAGESITVKLPGGYRGTSTVEIQQTGVTQAAAVNIVAQKPVTVYALSYKRYSSDAFRALPVSTLGKEYYILSYLSSLWKEKLPYNNGPPTPSQFTVVGAFDNTQVSITPSSKTSANNDANVEFSITLNRGDVYLVQGLAEEEMNDLTGTYIRSSKPIAVFSGHERTGIPEGFNNVGTARPSRDQLLDQMPPISSYGDTVIIVPYAGVNMPDIVRILSASDNNTINVNDSVIGVLNAGKFFEIQEIDKPLIISGSSPILVGQYMHTNKYSISVGGGNPQGEFGDPSLAIQYPTKSYFTSQQFAVFDTSPGYKKNIVTIITQQSAANVVLLNRVPIDSMHTFMNIPNSNYSYVHVELLSGHYEIESSSPLSISVYGIGPAESYTYGCGVIPQVNADTIQSSVDHISSIEDRMSIYPNPVVNGVENVTVSISPLTDIESIELMVFDILGRKMYSAVHNNAGSSAEIQIPREKLTNGHYRVRARLNTSKEFREISRLLVVSK